MCRKRGVSPSCATTRPRFEGWLREHGFAYPGHRRRYRKGLVALRLEFRGRPPVPPPSVAPRAAFAAYGRAILQTFPEVAPDRFNASIATQMRQVGFPPKVAETLSVHASCVAKSSEPGLMELRAAHDGLHFRH